MRYGYFGLIWCFTSQSTRRAVHLTTLFFLGKLEEAVNQYSVYILSLVTDNSPSWIGRRKENGPRNYFMINRRESMGPCRNPTHDPWICSQTRYRLHYVALCMCYWWNNQVPKINSDVWKTLWILDPCSNHISCTNSPFRKLRPLKLFVY